MNILGRGHDLRKANPSKFCLVFLMRVRIFTFLASKQLKLVLIFRGLRRNWCGQHNGQSKLCRFRTFLQFFPDHAESYVLAPAFLGILLRHAGCQREYLHKKYDVQLALQSMPMSANLRRFAHQPPRSISQNCDGTTGEIHDDRHSDERQKVGKRQLNLAFFYFRTMTL